MGKLDAVTVNGPEDDVLDWDAVDWRQVEDDVRRLRQRIFTATQAGDLKRVRNLQRLMLRSRANALLSVRRVTEINAGRKTAGVDRRVVGGSSSAPVSSAAWVRMRSTRCWTLSSALIVSASSAATVRGGVNHSPRRFGGPEGPPASARMRSTVASSRKA
jgi:hypothetical protein